MSYNKVYLISAEVIPVVSFLSWALARLMRSNKVTLKTLGVIMLTVSSTLTSHSYHGGTLRSQYSGQGRVVTSFKQLLNSWLTIVMFDCLANCLSLQT